MCAYRGVRNVSFLKNCSFVLTGYSLRLDDLFNLLFFMYMFYGLLVVIPSFRSVIFLVFVVLFKIIVIKIYSLVCVKTTFSLSKTVIAIITSWIMESRLFSDIIDNFLCSKGCLNLRESALEILMRILYRRNSVPFTPTQVEAIKSGMQPGLTVVVGPPGTGKTDVAVQIISNIYHNFPEQRTLIVTHSNQVSRLVTKSLSVSLFYPYLL